jgi:glycerol-3-phosphate dehydrogenase
MSFGPADRSARVASLSGTQFDILIVGGGICGVATARDAAMRGFKVACVEKEDFAYGTSSRSSKLIHGGLRYLEQANFKLVFEGTHERATLRAVAPHLVKPIQFLVPVYEGGKHGRLALGMGLWLYDALAGRNKTGKHSRHAAQEILELEPLLRSEGLLGGALYYDCMTDDARLCVENAVSAHSQGAVMLNRATFVEPVREAAGVITGARVRDEETGKLHDVTCRTIVHCAGPWTDDVLRRSGDTRGMIRTSKGIHILFARERLPLRYAVVMNAVRDRRVVFAIPRGRVTLVGTTDTDYDGDPDAVCATRDDVDYLLETVAFQFPKNAPTRADVRATYAGLRPLVRDESDNPYDTSREHTVVARPDGSVTIGGGKYTTYRRIADDVVKATMGALGLPKRGRPKCPTRNAELPGAVGLDAPGAVEEARKALAERGAPPDVQDYLLEAYGSRAALLGRRLDERLLPGFPFTVAEVDFAVQHEAAASIEDVLMRRIPIFFEAPDQGLECLEAVATHVAELLAWEPATRREQIDRYRATVALSRRWKAEV